MKKMTRFDFKGNEISTILDEYGRPWLIAKEVCDILGLEPRDSVRYLDDDEKSYVSRNRIGLAPGKPMFIINESGLYNLVLKSRKPEAKAFRKWITSEVLPQIRKTGGYSTNDLIEALNDPSTMRNFLLNYQKIER